MFTVSRQLPPVLNCSRRGLPLLYTCVRQFSVLNRPPPNYEGHVPLTPIERVGLAIGSSLAALINPRRGDLIAVCGEATAVPYFIYRLRNAMLSDPTGRRILRDRPRITSRNMPIEKLRNLPENSVGRTYATWLEREGVSPDTRLPVRYIDDEECAYVMQRYRECHDFYHAIVGLPIFLEGEVAVKAFEFANTLLPMAGGAMLAAFKLPTAGRKRFWNTYLPWALKNGFQSKELINVYWEEELARDVDDLRAELGIERPPDLRDIRNHMKEQRKAAKEARAGSEGQDYV
ncbi:MAG: Ubiquinone biosynthesis protein [Cirrosporium novae-zelandiae]|nr:MAG: Ubiquinone biosynthesis protein [Cirrosporium novae-zelandiae]